MEKVNTEAPLITIPMEHWVEQTNIIKNYKCIKYIYIYIKLFKYFS